MKKPTLIVLAVLLLAALAWMLLRTPFRERRINVQIHTTASAQEASLQAFAYAAQVGAMHVGIVPTDSMEPHFPAGRTIVVSEPGIPKPGEAVTFMSEGQRYVHVAVEWTPQGLLITRGSNTAKNDTGARSEVDIVGVVRHAWVFPENKP